MVIYCKALLIRTGKYALCKLVNYYDYDYYYYYYYYKINLSRASFSKMDNAIHCKDKSFNPVQKTSYTLFHYIVIILWMVFSILALEQLVPDNGIIRAGYFHRPFRNCTGNCGSFQILTF